MKKLKITTIKLNICNRVITKKTKKRRLTLMKVHFVFTIMIKRKLLDKVYRANKIMKLWPKKS